MAINHNRQDQIVVLVIQMEFAEGGGLDQWLYEGRNVAGKGRRIQDVGRDALIHWKFLIQILNAVKYIHGQGVAHRDLKPENIFMIPKVRSSGSYTAEDVPYILKIGDFGLSKELRWDKTQVVQHRAADRTRKHIAVRKNTGATGTHGYMSPEMRAGKSRDDQANDIYSVGVMLYELSLTLRPSRWNAIDNWGTDGRFPTKYPVEHLLALRMTHIDPTKRPTARQLLADASALLKEATKRNLTGPPLMRHIFRARMPREPTAQHHRGPFDHWYDYR